MGVNVHKVGDNGLIVKCKGAVSLREGYPVQIKPILFEISDKVLVTISILQQQSYLKRLKSCDITSYAYFSFYWLVFIALPPSN